VEGENAAAHPLKRRKEETPLLSSLTPLLPLPLASLPLSLPPPSPPSTESNQATPQLDLNLDETLPTPSLTSQAFHETIDNEVQNSTNRSRSKDRDQNNSQSQSKREDNAKEQNDGTTQGQKKTRKARKKRSNATTIQIQITRKAAKNGEDDREEGELTSHDNTKENFLTNISTDTNTDNSKDNIINTSVTLSHTSRRRRAKEQKNAAYYFDENPEASDFDWFNEYNQYNLQENQPYDHDYYDSKDYETLYADKNSLHNSENERRSSNSLRSSQKKRRSKKLNELIKQQSVDKKPKPRRYCTCEGHLTDKKKKRSFYTHQYPGEEFIPKCVLTRNGNAQKPTLNNTLYAYKLTANPSIVRANYKRTTIIDRENGNKEFSFNGFVILTHSPINMPPYQITHMGTAHTIKLEPMDINEILDYLDFEIMDWFYEYLWLGIMEFSDFLRPTYKDEGEKHIHGCPRFHIFPQFICKIKKTKQKEMPQSHNTSANKMDKENPQLSASQLSSQRPPSSEQQTTQQQQSQRQLQLQLQQQTQQQNLDPQQQIIQVESNVMSHATNDKPKQSPRRPRKDFQLEYFPLFKLKHFLETVPRNVYQILRFYLDFYGETKGKVKASRWLETQIVMTTYSRRAFRVDEIEWQATPDFTFTTCDQKQMTYKEYMEKVHNRTVTIPTQPLLFHKRVNFTKYVPLFRETERKGNFQLARLSYQIQRRPTFLRLLSEFVNITGIRADICQWALLVPAVLYHARLMSSLMEFEKKIDIQFNDIQLLKQVMIHPSYWEMMDSVAEEIRDASSRVGSWFVSEREKQKAQKNNDTVQWQLLKRQTFAFMDYEIHDLFTQNQRLEFLGDALLEFITSSHLYLLFPDHREGELSHIRTGLVNNKVLCHFAELLGMHKYVLYPYHDELLEDTKSRCSVVADCYESLLGAIYLDRGMLLTRLFLANSMFADDPDRERLVSVWLQPQPDPLLMGPTDRHLINQSPTLQRLTRLEENTGIYFPHIRLLAAAFTHPSVGNPSASNAAIDLLQTGSNQRLEFLGDSVLQFLVSRYIYNRFPEFLEGQLSLVRTTLVNNDVLAQVAVELGLNNFIRYLPNEALLQDGRAHAGMLADTFEAYLAAMYLDRSLGCVEAFLGFVLFPRIDLSIKEKLWIDPKTKLARTIFNITKTRNFIPHYKVLSEAGPPHMRTFTVACYVGGYKLSEGRGISIHAAEQDAAKNTLLQYDFTKPLPEKGPSREPTTRKERTNIKNNNDQSSSGNKQASTAL
jgi:dsRNA-specific ribonuclease